MQKRKIDEQVMKPIATVQLPIAKFVLNVLERNDDHELATWIRAFTRSLAKCDPSLDDFAAELLNDVNEYRKEDARKKREKRKSLQQQSSSEEERSALPSHSIPSLEEVYDYARGQELDDIFAREWYEMTSERQWSTRDGEIIKNWKSALKAYVKKRISNIIKQETKL